LYKSLKNKYTVIATSNDWILPAK
ncbi:hypothetical protein EVA_22344, partial [gut metagenome]